MSLSDPKTPEARAALIMSVLVPVPAYDALSELPADWRRVEGGSHTSVLMAHELCAVLRAAGYLRRYMRHGLDLPIDKRGWRYAPVPGRTWADLADMLAVVDTARAMQAAKGER